MAIHPLAGEPVPANMLIDVARLERAYREHRPDVDDPSQRVSFGTSGHRGTSLDGSFTEAHILAITQAICEWRCAHGIDGPLFLGKDTHALSAPAQRDAIEVLAAGGVETILQRDDGFTPTPVISRAILAHNSDVVGPRVFKVGPHSARDLRARDLRRGRAGRLADGIVVTPSHNPPSDGGFKYNPPNGGPADTDITGWIQDRANALLRAGNAEVKRVPHAEAMRAATTREEDFVGPYVEDLSRVIDFDVIRAAGVRIGVDPLGGAAVGYWARIAERYGLDITVVNPAVDPTFRFMTLDHDGKIRMDCSSPYAMAGLVKLKDQFDVAWGNDADADRHGIVTPSLGLLNPNHYLAVAIAYLLANRPGWPKEAAVGKTLVSSSLIDRVVEDLGRRLSEVPVGFKWFVEGLLSGSLLFGGEESAGASFLRMDGTVWTTDKDGLILGLLAAEITARTGKDPGRHARDLTMRFGTPCYTRIDTPATPEEKEALKRLSPEAVKETTLAGDAITARLTRAPGNGAVIGGLKVVSTGGWFAARPSGTEDIYKLYAESFKDSTHLDAIVDQARQIVRRALAAG